MLSKMNTSKQETITLAAMVCSAYHDSQLNDCALYTPAVLSKN